MLIPAEGIKGIKKFILDSVIAASADPCPPTIVGVGIGGTSDLVTLLAKKAATLRPVGSKNADPEIAALEAELLEAINKTGIGPNGLGGLNTSMAVHIEEAHTHITQVPVAVNCQCWPARRAGAKLYADGRIEYHF
jgi:fumarate hydratase subunit alpha/L(+)-tartrate dehydratase alpha subunit